MYIKGCSINNSTTLLHRTIMGNLDLTSFLDTTEDESMCIDSDVPSVKPTRGRKRKNSETATKERRVAGRAHATKRARGNRGILKELVEMPLDVFFEVPRVPFSTRTTCLSRDDF
jgi:hypothetical protein